MRYSKLHISLVSHVVLYHCVYQPACIEVLQEKQEIKVLWGNIKVGQFQIANLQATHSLTQLIVALLLQIPLTNLTSPKPR